MRCDLRDFTREWDLNLQALQVAVFLDYRWGEGVTLLQLGNIARMQGDYVQAFSLIERARAIFREIGDKPKEVTAVSLLAQLYSFTGELDVAQTQFEEFLRLQQEIEAPDAEGVGYFIFAALGPITR